MFGGRRWQRAASVEFGGGARVTGAATNVGGGGCGGRCWLKPRFAVDQAVDFGVAHYDLDVIAGLGEGDGFD